MARAVTRQLLKTVSRGLSPAEHPPRRVLDLVNEQLASQ